MSSHMVLMGASESRLRSQKSRTRADSMQHEKISGSIEESSIEGIAFSESSARKASRPLPRRVLLLGRRRKLKRIKL